MSTNAKPYKETLNLPVTRFDMKANLSVREPQIQARWQEQRLYEQLRQARAGAPRKVLHDGPPYANGAIHLGLILRPRCARFRIRGVAAVFYRKFPLARNGELSGWEVGGEPPAITFGRLGLSRRTAAGGDQSGRMYLRSMYDVPDHCLPARPTPTG